MSLLLQGSMLALVLASSATHDARRTTHDARRTTHDDPPVASNAPESRPWRAAPPPDPRVVEEHFRTVPHVQARRGASVRFLKDGRALIVEPCGASGAASVGEGAHLGCNHDHEGEGESIHWFCAQSQGNCFGGNAVTCPFAPYAVSTPPPAGFPNPNTKSPVYAGPPARFWPQPTVDFYVNCPQGEDNLNTALSFEDVFPFAAFAVGSIPTSPYHPVSCGGAANPYYRYSEFLWDVCFTMAKYGKIAPSASHPALPSPTYVVNGGTNSVLQTHRCAPFPLPATLGSPYVTVVPTFRGISGPAFPPFPAGGAVPPPNKVDAITNFYGTFPGNCLFDNPIRLVAAKQIWEVVDASGTSGSGCSGTGGPTGDGINELIWIDTTGSASFIGLTSSLVDPTSGKILECDVLFFKRPQGNATWPTFNCFGVPPLSAGCANGVGPGATTVYGHEIGHFLGLDHTNLHPGIGLTSGISSTFNPALPAQIANNAITNFAPSSLAAYTAAVPGTAPPVFTSVGWSAMPDMVAAITPTNVWLASPSRPVHPDEQAALAELYGVSAIAVVPVAGGGAAYERAIINDCARWEGAVRIWIDPTSESEAPTPNPFGLNVFPLTVGPAAKSYPDVGKIAGTAALTVGDVVGRRDTTTGAPSSAQFRMEGVVVGGSGSDLALCVEPLQSMFITPLGPGFPFAEWWQFATGYGTTGLNRVWNVGATFEGPIQQQLVSRTPHPSSRGTLYSFPGTVLEVDVLIGPGAPTVETVTRPAISVTPRDATLLTPGAVLTATVYHDYELDLATARWDVVGGASIPAGVPSFTTQPTAPLPAGATGPWQTTFLLPVASVPPVPGGRTVRFVCVELPGLAAPATFRPPLGVLPVRGVNEVRL